jgi:hypothetical protein
LIFQNPKPIQFSIALTSFCAVQESRGGEKVGGQVVGALERQFGHDVGHRKRTTAFLQNKPKTQYNSENLFANSP